MSRREASNESNLQAVLETGREVPRQPEAVRARVLARVRATAALPPTPASLLRTPPPVKRSWSAPALAGALSLGIGGLVYAVGGHGSSAPVPRHVTSAAASGVGAAPVVASGARAPDAAAAPPLPLSPTGGENAPPAAESARLHARRQAEAAEPYQAELGLMRSAHTAYAAHEFSNALVLIGEHARRFPNGLLAEEREALRVRCLLGSGRTSEARRVAAQFATRFPRSVLLSRIQSEVATDTE